MDVGTGGESAISAAKSGVPYIDGVDQNPNAIYSLNKVGTPSVEVLSIPKSYSATLSPVHSSFSIHLDSGRHSGSVDNSILSELVYLNDFSTKRTNAVHDGRIV